MNKSNDYHDYVFRSGNFIGKFEDMYRYSKEIPWNQDKVIDSFYKKIPLEILKSILNNKVNSIKKVIEVGCGYGYVLSNIYTSGIFFSGFDISETAIERAKKLHNNINFFVDDIIHLKHSEKYDLVVVMENLWYVIDHFEKAISNIKSLTKDNGYIFISLSFPKLNHDYYGKNILPNTDALLNVLANDFENLVVNVMHYSELKNNGPMLSYLGKKS